MPVDNSDLNELLIKATKPYKPKPWYVRWWEQFVYNLKIACKVAIAIFLIYCMGNFIMEHPVLFMMMVAALG